jgi:hypothetical protein
MVQPAGNAKFIPISKAGCAVVLLPVVDGKANSSHNALLDAVAFVDPLLRNTRRTVGTFVPNALTRILSTKLPSVASAVKTVTVVPVPSIAVFCADMDAIPIWGVLTNIGAVFAAISKLFR